MMVGGEKTLPADAAAWQELETRVPLFNMYGPTEATITATGMRAPRVPDPGWLTLPIGRPLANVSGTVVSRDGAAMPVGLPGRLQLGGAGVARGYMGRPATTAERFVPATERTARVYDTGDRVRYRRDTQLEFLERDDRQVKVRGFRVEPAEVEAALRAHPAVADAVVVANGKVDRLVAYVVAHGAVTAEELGGRLAENLPGHLVPSAFLLLTTLPLTAADKVDVRALPSPDRAATTEALDAAPRNRTEEGLANIWSQVLKLERVGIHDDFFALGGHSLAAIEVVWRVRTELGRDLPVRDLFQAPTVAQLAALLGPAPSASL